MLTSWPSKSGSQTSTLSYPDSVETTKTSSTPPASLCMAEQSQKRWKPVDSVLYEDLPAPAEETPRFLNVTSLYPDWHKQALCVGKSDVLFFGASDPDTRPPYTLGDIKRAKAICHQCPVAAMCLRSALVNREEYGVWAGTTRKQRKRWLSAIDARQITVESVVTAYEEARSE